MPKFDKTRRYVNKKGQKFGKGVWIDDDGKVIYPGQSRNIDREHKTVTQYNSDGTKTVYPWQEWAKKTQRDHEVRVLQNDRKYAIPYIPEKKMTITIDKDSPTRKAAGATFSENMLDSIAVNAQRAKLPFSKAIGLVSKESTFGQQDRGVGRSMLPWERLLNSSKGEWRDKAAAISYAGHYSPTLLISDWKQQEEYPFYDFNYNSLGELLEKPRDDEFYKKGIHPTRVKANRYQLREESPLEHGFREFREKPGNYNPGDPNYEEEVRARTEELMHSPEIRAYMQKHNLHAEGGYLDNSTPWNELPLSQKAAIIKEAVNNDIYSLQDIRKAYSNNGHLFYTGGPAYTPSASIRKRIAGWEGSSMYKPAPDTGKVNRSFEAEAQDFNRVIPASVRAKLSQDQLDALYSYGYNVGMGNLKKRVLPTLTNYVNGRAGAEDVASSMWASRDNEPKMGGLRRRRAFERNQFINGSSADTRQSIVTQALNADLSQLPATPVQQPDAATLSLLYASNPTDYGTPVDYRTPEKAVEELTPSPVEERQNGWGLFSLIQSLGAPQQTSQPLASYKPTAETSSPFVVAVPSASNTMLNASWFADGGPTKGTYSDWKKAIAEHNGIHVDEDDTYDYEGYYNKYPAQAWAMLSDDPEAHFTDEFKTVNHPSFSNQSKYSGKVDTRFNPEGIIGGTWSEDGKRYTLSEDQARHRWDIGRTMDYLGRAENNGVEGFYPDGRHWTTVEGDPWGGVLPAVTVTPKKKAEGGYLFDDGGVKMHYYSKDTPVEYNGVEYPGARMVVDGREQSVFTDGTGTVWGLREDGSPYKILYQHELPEVTVCPKPRDAVKDYFTESNDATAVADGRPLNPHLQERVLKGAKAHALWEEEHPNLAAWSYAAGAVPFAVAAAPLVVGAGDMAAGTALGQGVTRGLTGLVNMAQGSTWLPWADAAATSYFGAHGLNEIVNGNVNPESLLEVAPLGRLARPIYETGKTGALTLADNAGFFVRKPDSFTRGIGGEAGLEDLFTSGVVRGNPRGTAISANSYAKYIRRNRDHYADIFKDAEVDPNRWYRNEILSEDEFNKVRSASQKYLSGNKKQVGKLQLHRSSGPLDDYDSYEEYVETLKNLNNPTSVDDSGQALAYFYDDGRDPLKAGHDYAASTYGVRVNNASNYNPRIFDGHLHYSFPEAVSLNDPNVEVFRKQSFGPFSWTRRMKKPLSNSEFISELDWSPESWFGTRINGAYDVKDVAALQSHVPEYLGIEQQAKANGTWLKMPDGSTWEGDPRSWVQLQSKEGQQLMQRPFYHAEAHLRTPKELGLSTVWASSNKYLPRTYNGTPYVLSFPKDAEIKSVDAEGHQWFDLSHLGYDKTDDVFRDLLNKDKDNVVVIRNVKDEGLLNITPGQEGLPPMLSGESEAAYRDRVFMGDDYIFGKNSPRKSLLGNNGNFDLKNPNIYKAILPFGVMSPLNNSQNK